MEKMFAIALVLDFVGEGEFGQSFTTLEGRDQERKFMTEKFGVHFNPETIGEHGGENTMVGTSKQLYATLEHIWDGADDEIEETMACMTELTHWLEIDANFEEGEQCNLETQFNITICAIDCDACAMPTYMVYGTSDNLIKFVKEHWAPTDDMGTDFWLDEIKSVMHG